MSAEQDELLQQAVKAHKAGDSQAAERLYRSILEIDAAHPDANHNLGVLLVHTQDAKDALPYLKTALQANPKQMQYWLSAIDALITADQIEVARNLLHQGQEKGLKGDQVDKLVARIESSQGSKTSGDTLPPEKKKEILTLYSQGKFEELLQQENALLKEFSQVPLLINIFAEINFRFGRFPRAIDLYKRAIELKPDYAEAYNNMGAVYKEVGNLTRALELFKRATELKLDYPEPYNNMGSIYRQQNNLSAALKSYLRLVELKPESPSAHNSLGVAYKDAKRIPAAIKCLKRAIEIKPDYVDAYNNLGVAQMTHGHFDAAIKTFNHALKLNPEDATIYVNMSTCFKDQGNNEKAIASYKHSIEIQPELVEAHYNLGGVFLKNQQTDSAIESFQRAIEIKPNFVAAVCDLGVAYKEKTALEVATKKYIEALVIDPEYKVAWNNISFTIKSLQISADVDLDSYYEQLRNIDVGNVNYNILQYKLEAFQPHLADKSFDDAVNVLAANSADEITNPQTPDQSSITPSVPDKMIALLHFGRSGTGLLHSLIDNHSEISTLPSIYFSEYFGTIHKENEGMWKALTINGWDQIPESFVSQYEVLFDASSSRPVVCAEDLVHDIGTSEGMSNVGENRDEVLTVDRDIFCKELRGLMSGYRKLDASTFFTLVHVAYETALSNPSDKHTIFYHIHNPTVYTKLNFLRYRPDARFIMMVREPLQSCESWIKRQWNEADYKEVSNAIIEMLFDIDQIAFRRCDSVGVRLEDLKLHPDETIASLCDWMGIEEEPGLYEMTAQGKKWWGDPSSVDYSEAGMSPFDDKSIRRQIGSIFSDRDQFILRTFFYPFSVKFGYVDEDIAGFRRDLIAVKPMLEELFDFEKQIASDRGIDLDMYKKSVSYLYLRAGLLDRWKVLDEFSDYPHMLTPLKIELNT